MAKQAKAKKTVPFDECEYELPALAADAIKNHSQPQSRTQLSPAERRANWASHVPIDEFILGPVDPAIEAYRTVPSWPHSFRVIKGNSASVCPNSEPRIQRQQVDNLSQSLRKRRMIAPGESIHWVGNQATLESICNCVLGGASTKATDDADGQQWFISHGNDVCTSPDGPERVVGTGRYVFPNGIERVVTPAQNRLLIAFRKRRILTGEQLRQNAKIGDPIGVLKRLAREISPSNAIDLPSPDRPTGYRIFVRAEEIQPARTP